MIAVVPGERRPASSAGDAGDAPAAGALRVQAALLCGGQSSRMGADKARLRLGEADLLTRARLVLEQVTSTLFLATGAEKRYGELGLETVLDREPGLGPLAGLEAALARLEATGGELLCVLACDMPYARAEIFRALLDRVEETGADACLLKEDANIEPLFAVYRRTTLPHVRRALAAGERRLTSFHPGIRVEVLRLSTTISTEPKTPTPGTSPTPATNLNTREDLERAARWEEEGEATDIR